MAHKVGIGIRTMIVQTTEREGGQGREEREVFEFMKLECICRCISYRVCVCVCRQKVGNKQGAKRSGEGATEKGEAAVTATADTGAGEGGGRRVGAPILVMS